MLVRTNENSTISMFGCRMRDYKGGQPITILNPWAVIRVESCIDKTGIPFRFPGR